LSYYYGGYRALRMAVELRSVMGLPTMTDLGAAADEA
jgi:hypothetical protein